MRHVAGILALFLALLALPASAIETGSAAWAITDLVVYEGPGVAYQVLGDIDGKTKLRVDRCTYRWCRVHQGSVRGWVWRDDLSFGREPRRFGTGPVLNYKSGGPGQACFFEGRNYTGHSVCFGSGYVSHDLLLLGIDNRYSSVSIEGNVSVMLCRDRDFSSYCERVNESEPRLHGFLDNNVSSVEVY